MLRLMIKDEKVQTGTVAVSWCTDKETLNLLRKHGRGGEAKLVIVVAPEEGYSSGKQQRYEVPLESGMTFIEFRHSGVNNVFAFIVVGSPYRHSDFLERDGVSWRSTVLNRDGKDFCESRLHAKQLETYNDGLKKAAARAEESGWAMPEPPPPPPYSFVEHVDERSAKLRVEVPKGVFAKEAPKWEQKWVNWLFNSKPVDQCAYRRRRLLAYTPFLKPLGFLLLFLFRIGAVLFLLLTFLMRGISFRPLTSPLESDTEDIWDNLDGPLFLNEKWWYLSFVLVTPFFMAIAYGIAMWIFSATGAPFGLSWWVLLLAAPVFVLASGLAITAVVGIIALPLWLIERSQEKHISAPIVLDKDTEDYLICSPNRKAAFSVSDLPRDRRTIKLRFQALKAKVCRPFSA